MCPPVPLILLAIGQLHRVRQIVSVMAGGDVSEVRVVVSPYRICPLGAHIDHQVRYRFTSHLFFILSGIYVQLRRRNRPAALPHKACLH